MTPILKKTLDKIEEEANSFNESFVLVDELLKEYGENNLANRLYSEIEESISWVVVADLFGILIWSTSDNGHELIKETEQWLIKSYSPRKILIALNLDVYPFLERAEMETVLNNIISKYPSLAEECNKIIARRRKEKE